MNMGLWTYEGFKNGDSLTWVAYGGMAIMVVSQLALKANVSMQNALYGGTMVQPLAQEGYISERYNELNKDDLPIKGSILNFIITAAVLCVWLIIPDLYEGIAGADPVFSVSQLTEASSAITLFIYAMVILSVAIHGFKKRLKVHGVEWAMFGLVFVLFVAMFFYHYATLFINLKGFGSKNWFRRIQCCHWSICWINLRARFIRICCDLILCILQKKSWKNVWHHQKVWQNKKTLTVNLF
jgi:L-asparagine transporter-like permease